MSFWHYSEKKSIQGDIVMEVGSSGGYIGWRQGHVWIKSGQSVFTIMS